MFTADAVNSHDRSIGALDPLGADRILAQLPHANAEGDTSWLISAAHELADRCVPLSRPDDARAAIRDLGFLVSSIGRHDPSAIAPCPWEAELLRLGVLADEVPRDTVYSYASRNPGGDRRRAFTASTEEQLFITNVTDGIGHLNRAVEAIGVYIGHQPGDETETLALMLTDLGVHLRNFAECLLRVKRAVSPEFFTGQLRPYYPPIRLGDRVYYGPGGAQMPQLVLDVVLLRPDRHAPLARWHDAYVGENAQYLPRLHRDLILAAANQSSGLVARLAASAVLGENKPLRDALRQVLTTVLRFRYPHQQLAKANMNIRPDGSVGSGGYSLDAVNQLVDLTSHAIDLVNPLEVA